MLPLNLPTIAQLVVPGLLGLGEVDELEELLEPVLGLVGLP